MIVGITSEISFAYADRIASIGGRGLIPLGFADPCRPRLAANLKELALEDTAIQRIFENAQRFYILGRKSFVRGRVQ